MLTAKHIHSTAATREVYHLLPCHLSWRHANSFTLNTMVGTEEEMGGTAQFGSKRLLYETQLHGQLFQSS